MKSYGIRKYEILFADSLLGPRKWSLLKKAVNSLLPIYHLTRINWLIDCYNNPL